MKLGFFLHSKANINLNFISEISDGCYIHVPATIKDATDLHFMKVIINHFSVSIEECMSA